MFRRDICPVILFVAILAIAEPEKLPGKDASTAINPESAASSSTTLPNVPQLAETSHLAGLSELAGAARDDFRPITDRQIGMLRSRLRAQSRRLEQALGVQGLSFRQRWKDYLHWQLLERQLSSSAKIDRKAVLDLKRVLSRFRRNQPGLERPEFIRTANAIEQLRVKLPWAKETPMSNSGKGYQRLMTELMIQLERHQEDATTETAWKIGRILGLIDQLGQSTSLVEAVHESLVQPNLMVEISEAFIQQAAGKPIRDTQPVHDRILGTSISGTAHTTGLIHIRTVASKDDVQLEIQLAGDTRSLTNGYQGPIRICSSGNTHFVTSKRVVLSAASFRASSAIAHADTQTKIHSIQKMGRPFGHQLIERIAWKKACQSKECAERIASRHAEAKIVANFDAQMTTALTRARESYEQKIRAPLARRNMQLSQLRMFSQADRVRVETVFASRHQLASAGLSPRLAAPKDLAVRIHQSAINNYLAMTLAGVTIQQDAADHPLEVLGDLPPWMSKLSLGDQLRDKRPVKGTSTKRAGAGVTGPAAGTSQPAHGEFLPWSITLNAERPVSVGFDNRQLNIRLRAARLISGDREYRNWDFIIRYELLPRENTVLLRRIGKIEVFPTGFDPRWDKSMSSVKSGFRSTLARNMNARADRGESFPVEILLQPIRLPEKLGIQGELTLQQLDCDHQWLTLGWTLP